MQRLEINPCNWVTEKVFLKTYADEKKIRISYDGKHWEEYRIEKSSISYELDGEKVTDVFYKAYMENETEFPIAVATDSIDGDDSSIWEAFHNEIKEESLSRRSGNPFVAIARVICNVL